MSKGKLLAVCFVWLVIAGGLAAAYRLLIYPMQRAKVQQETGSDSQYDHAVTMALDSFSGYAVLRSPKFREQLAGKRIRVNLQDDRANYAKRIKALSGGEADMAVFTIDAYLKACASLNETPGTIVAIIDETRGADAMVAYKSKYPNVDALNRASTRFVLTPDSPSETLLRVVTTQFNLDNVVGDPVLAADDADDVFNVYKKAKRGDDRAYVVWEPYVSRMLENPDMHVLVDSSRFRGYIVDVLVVNRDYLVKNPEVVEKVVAAYFSAAYQYRDSMVELVLTDAKETGAPVTKKQAERLVEGIWWKNTQENFAHFGLRQNQPVQMLEDMIANINQVLLRSNAMPRDPTNGQPTSVIYNAILVKLQQQDFHPGINRETIRNDQVELPALSDDEWEKLAPEGTLRVRDLVFAPGTARLSGRSHAVLNEVIETLKNWPQYYLLIRGNISTRGDREANVEVARLRAEAAHQYLIQAGVAPQRLQPVTADQTGSRSVSFVLGQPAY